MKFSVIKTTIQKPIKKILPYAIGVTVLGSCTPQPTSKIKDYCKEFNKPAIEYKECVNKCEGNYSPKDQAVLDSLVYRDLLNEMNLANDSSTIVEFNRIAATNKYQDNPNFETNLLKEGISTKEFNDIRSEIFPAGGQFAADKTLYGKLFREKGLMTKEFNARFRALSLFLHPSRNIPAHDIKHYEKNFLERQ